MKHEMVECPECGPHNVASLGLGMSRDFDSDLSYGLPICVICGGLGRMVDVEDFTASVTRIYKLRIKFCPPARLNTGIPLPPALMGRYLGELVEAVQCHFNTYKELALYGCYAEEFFADEIVGSLAFIRTKNAEALGVLRQAKYTDPANTDFHQIKIAANEGDVEKLPALIEQCLERNSKHSQVWHDSGIIYLNFVHDLDNAERCLIASAKLEPILPLHAVQAIKLLLMRKKFSRLGEFIDQMLAIDNLPEEARQALIISKETLRVNMGESTAMSN
jgi:hypothetical protein